MTQEHLFVLSVIEFAYFLIRDLQTVFSHTGLEKKHIDILMSIRNKDECIISKVLKKKYP